MTRVYVALQYFDNDDDVAIELSRDDPAEALGVFAGDLERAGRFVVACDRPLSFVDHVRRADASVHTFIQPYPPGCRCWSSAR